MQTFLPYADFEQSAAALDNRRLGKQRVECWQILRALRGESRGWANHPAVRMWRGHEGALTAYARAICAEWIRRGFKDTMLARFGRRRAGQSPRWLGDAAFHAAHRSILLAKEPGHYARFGWTERPAARDAGGSYPYVWPV